VLQVASGPYSTQVDIRTYLLCCSRRRTKTNKNPNSHTYTALTVNIASTHLDLVEDYYCTVWYSTTGAVVAVLYRVQYRGTFLDSRV
jgi:hypothetical protein